MSSEEKDSGADASGSDPSASLEQSGKTDNVGGTGDGGAGEAGTGDAANVGQGADQQPADGPSEGLAAQGSKGAADSDGDGDGDAGVNDAGRPAVLDDHVEAIAQVCNDTNAAYAESIGDFTYGPWDNAPEAVRQSIRDGVRKHLENPDLTPEQSHEAWLEFKRGQGYTYGPQRDDEAKVHPCVVPYADLPQAQRSKDFIFRAVVHSMSRLMGLA